MNNIVFLGTNFNRGKGGVASVLNEYKKLFPEAYFIATTNSNGFISNSVALIIGLLKFVWLLTSNRKIKIIHIHGASYNSFYRKYVFFRIAKLYHKKVIYHIHGGEYHLFYNNSSKITKNLIKNLIEDSDCIICLSEKWMEYFKKEFNPINICIIPNIIKEPNTLLTKKTLNNEKITTFLFLGYISERKGVWLLLKALYEIKSQLDGRSIFQFGGNGEVSVFKKLVSVYKLENLVEYIGWVTDETKDKYLRNADVFILPSYNEGLPITLLEAMSYQLPIISTTVGGIPEIIESGKNGILVEPGEKAALINAIMFLINNTSFHKQFGEKNLEIVKKHFPVNVKKHLQEIYSSLLN